MKRLATELVTGEPSSFFRVSPFQVSVEDVISLQRCRVSESQSRIQARERSSAFQNELHCIVPGVAATKMWRRGWPR